MSANQASAGDAVGEDPAERRAIRPAATARGGGPTRGPRPLGLGCQRAGRRRSARTNRAITVSLKRALRQERGGEERQPGERGGGDPGAGRQAPEQRERRECGEGRDREQQAVEGVDERGAGDLGDRRHQRLRADRVAPRDRARLGPEAVLAASPSRRAAPRGRSCRCPRRGRRRGPPAGTGRSPRRGRSAPRRGPPGRLPAASRRLAAGGRRTPCARRHEPAASRTRMTTAAVTARARAAGPASPATTVSAASPTAPSSPDRPLRAQRVEQDTSRPASRARRSGAASEERREHG